MAGNFFDFLQGCTFSQIIFCPHLGKNKFSLEGILGNFKNQLNQNFNMWRSSGSEITLLEHNSKYLGSSYLI